jgi:hypothetical protein
VYDRFVPVEKEYPDSTLKTESCTGSTAKGRG